MTILSRPHVIRLLALGILLIVPVASGAQERPPIVQKLATTYGLESFGQIEAIRYTFNAQLPGVESFSIMDLGAEDRPGHLRGERQGGQAGQGYIPALAARQPAGRRAGGNRPGLCKRPVLAALPISCFLGRRCDGGRCRHAEAAAGTGFRR